MCVVNASVSGLRLRIVRTRFWWFGRPRQAFERLDALAAKTHEHGVEIDTYKPAGRTCFLDESSLLEPQSRVPLDLWAEAQCSTDFVLTDLDASVTQLAVSDCCAMTLQKKRQVQPCPNTPGDVGERLVVVVVAAKPA
ncbi:hypothetical protein C8245_18165 [Paracidovorax avenae]|nr:hypothetical protein C8245_18165 [Paracidovorax avenae]